MPSGGGLLEAYPTPCGELTLLWFRVMPSGGGLLEAYPTPCGELTLPWLRVMPSGGGLLEVYPTPCGGALHRMDRLSMGRGLVWAVQVLDFTFTRASWGAWQSDGCGVVDQPRVETAPSERRQWGQCVWLYNTYAVFSP